MFLSWQPRWARQWNDDVWHELLGLALLISLAMTAAGSFRRERDSGMLELLLVSPLGSGRLVWGRIRGIWRQFLPAFLVLVLIAYCFWPSFSRSYWNDSLRLRYFLSHFQEMSWPFLALPVVGLYYSLRTRHYIMAVVATLTVFFLEWTVFRPAVEYFIGRQIFRNTLALTWGYGPVQVSWVQVSYWAIVTWLAGKRLLNDLNLRRFHTVPPSAR
jgi:hypothetical protein